MRSLGRIGYQRAGANWLQASARILDRAGAVSEHEFSAAVAEPRRLQLDAATRPRSTVLRPGNYARPGHGVDQPAGAGCYSESHSQLEIPDDSERPTYAHRGGFLPLGGYRSGHTGCSIENIIGIAENDCKSVSRRP